MAPRLIWLFATNQLNLLYVLAGGLVTGPKGFGRKYFADALAVAPGWIPLFADVVPARAFEQAVAEGAHLRRVIAAFDLSPLAGPVRAIDHRGQLRELRFPDGLTGEEQVLLVPAPLPASWIQAILFAAKEDRAATLDDASAYANVPLGSYRQQVKPKLFAGRSLAPWPAGADTLPTGDAPYHRVSALGAAMALTFALGNAGDALVSAGRILCDPFDEASETSADPSRDPVLRGLYQWATLSPLADTDGIQTRLLLETLQAIVDAKTQADSASDGEPRPADTQQAVLELLEARKPWLTEEKWQEALNRLASDLRGILGLGGDTVSELLQRHQRPFSRGLILFFLQQGCDDLLAFRQSVLTDMDRLVAAVLFAARSGWRGIPAELRSRPGLSTAIQHRMASLAHRGAATGLDLGPPPPRIEPLRGLLTSSASGWNKRQQEAALRLARGMGWEAVLKTRVSLGKGEYRLLVEGNSVHLLLDGDVKAVRTDVDQARFLDLLAESVVPEKLDHDIRNLLKA